MQNSKWHKYLLQDVRLKAAFQNHKESAQALQKHTFFSNEKNKETVLPTITNTYSQCYPQNLSRFSLNH